RASGERSSRASIWTFRESETLMTAPFTSASMNSSSFMNILLVCRVKPAGGREPQLSIEDPCRPSNSSEATPLFGAGGPSAMGQLGLREPPPAGFLIYVPLHLPLGRTRLFSSLCHVPTPFRHVPLCPARTV